MNERKKIKILFDANPLVNSSKSGVGYYSERLLIALASKYPDDVHIVGHYFNFLNRKKPSLPQLPNISYKQTVLFPTKAVNILRRIGIEIPLDLFVRTKADFAIFPNFVSMPFLHHIPSAVIVHDLGYLECPEYILPGNRTFLTRFVPKSIKRSELVITISEATKSVIKRYYGTPDSKFLITPIPPQRNDIKPVKPADMRGKYILFLSTLEPRKNFIGLVRAYMLLPKSLRDTYGLVLAGGPGWNVDQELVEIQKLQSEGNNITTTGYISEGEKAWLLANASLFVMPSHYEGFGMPILEAMSTKTPAAVSDIPVFHEVAGDAAVYFDKDNLQSIARTIEDVLSDKTKQDLLVSNGVKRVAMFDWDDVAKNVFEKLESTLNKN